MSLYHAAQWYDREPKSGAVYLQSWSFHWCLDKRMVFHDGRVEFPRVRPWRAIHVYRGLHTILKLRLWPARRTHCKHGFRSGAFWHRCSYVTADNPDGRVPDRELYPEDYDENGVHWADRTCFCDLKPEWSICSMHPEDE